MEPISVRPIRRDDAPVIHALVRDAQVHDRHPLITTLSEIEEIFDEPHFDPAADARLAEAGGRAVGWTRLWHKPSGERLERAYLDGCVAPAHRRRGIDTALFGWGVDRATEVLRGYTHGLPCYIRLQCFDWESELQSLAARFGLEPVRYGEEMIRPLDTLPPRVPVEGVDVLSWAEPHAEPARQVTNAAFADHWGTTIRDEATWQDELESHGKRLDLSFVAVAEGRVIGMVRNANYPADEALLGRRDGWIELLAVLREHRKRGIASRLIVESLHAFAAAGLTHAMLGVDSENPTGAAALYRALGFSTLHRSITFELEVSAPGPA